MDIKEINWKKVNGLLPAIVQNEKSGDVLMLGYMNEEALRRTQETQKAHFWSRTKQRIWCKGETSGHFLNIKSLNLDCDQDALLIQAEPIGPTCHKGTVSCFSTQERNSHSLSWLEKTIELKRNEAPEVSYSAKLLQSPIEKVAKKVGEEGVEVAIAASSQSQEDLINESSDLIFHLLVLLKHKNLDFNSIIKCLEKRALSHKKSSIP